MPDDLPIVRRKISVVTPCYNAADYVAETIESVLAQSHTSLEHIVVDDASTDDSWDIIQRYAAKHPGRLIPLRNETARGAPHARNRGVRRASGEFVMFLDADDLIGPDTLALLARSLYDRSKAIAYCDWMRLTSAAGSWRITEREIGLPSPRPSVALTEWIQASTWVPTCSVLWRREDFHYVGGWDEEITHNQDGELMMRAFIFGLQPFYVEGALSYYRAHGVNHTSISQDFGSEKAIRARIRVLEKIGGLLEQRYHFAPLQCAMGTGYRRIGLFAFEHGFWELGRACVIRADLLGGRVPVSPTTIGRALEQIFGLEAKERLTQRLAQWGLASVARKRSLMRRLSVMSSPGATPGGKH